MAGFKAVLTRLIGLTNFLAFGVYNAGGVTLSDGNAVSLQVDNQGRLITVGAAGVTGATFGAANPASGSAVGASDGVNLRQLLVESSGNPNLRDAIYFGATRWVTAAITAISSFAGVPNVLPTAVYNATAPVAADGQGLTLQCDPYGALYVATGVLTGVPTQALFAATTATLQLLPANDRRNNLVIQNPDNANPVYITTNDTATADGNCWAIPAGTNFNAIRDWGFVPTTAMQIIAANATVNVNFLEGTAA